MRSSVSGNGERRHKVRAESAGRAMRLPEAHEKVERIVGAIERGGLPYKIVMAVLYGSAAKGDPNPQDVDLYLQLDWATVPEEDVWEELTRRSGSVSTRLNKALKLRNSERVSIQWGTRPWEEYRMQFIKPDEIESQLTDRMSSLDPDLKTHARAKRRLEKSIDKRKVKATEWPPFGIVVYPREPETGSRTI